MLWGDLADVLHLIVASSPTGRRAAASPDVATVRDALVGQRFDAIYLTGYAGGRVRFPVRGVPGADAGDLEGQVPAASRGSSDVIRSTAGVRLDHFLNDGDSPDIPIPIYVGYLNRIREMALETRP